MAKEKNIGMIYYYLKENSKMEKKMEKEKNMMNIMKVNYYLKVNI